jgi:RTX calcium-binding nonapeptide repeat (4 copies)
MRGRACFTFALLCGAAALMLPGIARADIGFQGPAYAAGTSGPATTSKPESKIWWNDGFWWASMFDKGSLEYHIFRLNLRTQKWINTGVVVDERDSTRQDVLSTGSKLFVASHKYVPVTSHDSTPMLGDEMRLYRFSYNAGTNTYTSDGAPTVIDPQKSEALVIDRDSTNALWATWVQETPGGQHQVYVKKTVGPCVTGALNQCDWSGVTTALENVAADDLSSLVRFGGNKIGVMWSNQAIGEMRFAFHQDADGEAVWSPNETVIGGNPKLADDHINLKADSLGRVYAVTKTKFTSAANPGTMLHRRSAAGSWSSFTVSRGSLDRTRPIVLVDQAHNAIRVFEGPLSGTVYMKRSRLSVISFPVLGLGTPVIRDVGSGVGNPTSTKQNTTNATRLIVLAANDATKRYWHAYQQIVPCVNGNAGNNVIVGTAGNDVLCGLGGNDTLRGLAGNDRLIGGPGRDALVGGFGRDSFVGAAGNDTIFSRDGFNEVVNGGVGFDRARVNAGDIRRSIERVF